MKRKTILNRVVIVAAALGVAVAGLGPHLRRADVTRNLEAVSIGEHDGRPGTEGHIAGRFPLLAPPMHLFSSIAFRCFAPVFTPAARDA